MSRFSVIGLIVAVGFGLGLLVPAGAQRKAGSDSLLTPEAKMDPVDKACLAAIAVPLQKSGGKLTPEVRKAYVEWCWTYVLQELVIKHRSVAGECVAEVEQDSVLKDAVSAAVYPPDPSILQNYAILRERLGVSLTKKYRNLAIGIAVSRRVKGVESNPDDSVGRENQGPIWAYEPLHRPGSGEERLCITRIAEFMRAKGCSALNLFNDDKLRSELAAYLTANNVEKKLVNEVARTTVFGERVKNAMIVLGQRPNDRTPKPPYLEWLKHLIAIYESKPESTPPQMGWPLFSLTATPWPLLTPLCHPAPMDEAKYLWQAYQGEQGSDRYHTYGPYRDHLTSLPDMLVPSHWFWNAVPDQIVHGGECMPISLATLDLYASLGKPAMDAAQPGHANLVTFQNEGGTWKAEVEQDFAGGPRVTYAQWFFDDPARGDLHFRGLFGWPGAEYHLGIAVGMNLGANSYLDTRIAARIFDVLPRAARPTFGSRLLTGALQENPFNPEIWYRLASESADSRTALALLQGAKNHDPKRIYSEVPCAALDEFLKSPKCGPAQGNMNDYWAVLQENLARFAILAKGAPKDEAAMHDMYMALKQVPGLEADELTGFTRRFVGFKSASGEAADVQYDLKLAEQSDAFGCLRMGQRYLDGDGVPLDDVRARDYLAKAARQGEPSAALLLDSLYTPIPTDGIEVVASSIYSSTQDVHHLIDGSGMTGGVHDNSVPASSMWQTVDNPPSTEPAPGIPASPAWVRFNFKQPSAFDAVEIWNHNQANLTDRGFRKLQIYGSYDGKHWSLLTKDAELPRASGQPNETSVTVQTDSTGRLFKHVIIAAAAKDGNFGSADYGLSAVRFVSHPPFSTVPAYQIEVHASSECNDRVHPNHLIDGSGMTGEFHDNRGDATSMWHSLEHPRPTLVAPLLYRSPAWVRFNFSIPRYVEAIRIWNHNQSNLTDRGFRKMRIYGTSDGIEWFLMTNTDDIYLPKATGAPLAAGTTIFNVSPERPVRSVALIADPFEGNYGGNFFGLSAVRFIVPSSVPETTKKTSAVVERSTENQRGREE